MTLTRKDIISVHVIKNSDLNKLFYPRTGGILLITTKIKEVSEAYHPKASR